MVFLVRLTGLEPAHRETLDPKSNASTNFATGAEECLKNSAKVRLKYEKCKKKQKKVQKNLRNREKYITFAPAKSLKGLSTVDFGALDERFSLRSAKPARAVRLRHAPQKQRDSIESLFCVYKYHYIGPYPIHDVVVTAVSAAVSTATITFTTTSQKFFLSFIILYFFTSSIYPSRFSERSEFRSACPLLQRVCTPD